MWGKIPESDGFWEGYRLIELLFAQKKEPASLQALTCCGRDILYKGRGRQVDSP